MKFENIGFRQIARPGSFVDVAAHGGDRSNCAELRNDLGRAHIAGMNNAIRPAQSFDCLRAQQAVGIGDNADQDGTPSGCIFSASSASTD